MAGSMMTGDGYGSHHRRQREDSCGWDSVFSSHPPRGRVPSVGKTSLSLRPPSMSQDARAAALSGGDSPTNRHCVSSLTVCSEESEVSVELLAQLMAEKKRLECVGHVPLATRMLDDEISRVRAALFHSEFVVDDLQLPEPQGEVVCVTEKVYVPIKEYPEYNFVGRILGPRGMTAKQLEQETGCKIMVRGRGSMRDRRRDDYGRGGVRSQWEHLDDDLHVLIQCEDTENRAVIKMRAAMEQVKRLLIPAPEGTDELKRKQLMELAIINGTYRPFHGRRDGPHSPPHTVLPSTPRLMTPMPMSPFRPPVFVHPSHSPMLSPPRMAYPHPPPQSPVAVQQMPPVPFDYNTLLSNLGGFTPSLIEALKDINMNHVVREPSCFFGGARSSTPPSSPSI